MKFGIESLTVRAFESREERMLVAAITDIFADVIGVSQRQDHQVVAASAFDRPGRRWPWSLRARPSRE